MSFASYNGSNRFKSPCAVCGKIVPAGVGILGGTPGNWTVMHPECHERAKAAAPLRRICAHLSLLPDERVTVSFAEKIPNDDFTRYLKTTSETGFYWDQNVRAQVGEVRGVLALIEAIHQLGWDVKVVDPGLTAKLQEKAAEAKEIVEGADDRADVADEILEKRGLRLYGLQRKSIRWLAARVGGVLAHPMGSGKTLMALTAILEGAPVLVISPANAKTVWLRETCRWRPDIGSCRVVKRAGLDYLEPERGITVLSGRGSFQWPKPGEMTIVNYDILPLTPAEHEDAVRLLAEWEQLGRPEHFKWTPPGSEEGAEPEEVGPEEIAQAERLAALKPVTLPPEGVVLIADEAHLVKARKAKRMSNRARRFRALSEYVRANKGRTWLLTGTPLLNEPEELWAVLTAAGVAQQVFGSKKRFDKLFRQEKDGTWVPSPHVPELLRRAMLRYRKEDFLSELPPKTRVQVKVAIRPEEVSVLDGLLAEVERMRGERFEEVFEAERERQEKIEARRAKEREKKRKKAEEAGEEAEDVVEEEKTDAERLREAQEIASGKATDYIPFEKLSEIRTILANAKIPALFRIVKEYVDRKEPIIVFADHLGPVEYIYEKLGREAGGWALVTGATPPKKRGAIEETFQRGGLMGIAATIGAAGVALTLTRARTAIFVEENWTPALNMQAQDRIHRLGQYHPVTIKVLVADHVIDEKIAELNRKKLALIEASVEAAAQDPEANLRTEADDLARAADLAKEAQSSGACPGERPPPGGPVSERGPARDERQRFVGAALTELSRGYGSSGFSDRDRGFGDSLARDLATKGLTERQWTAAANLIARYPQYAGDPSLSVSLSPSPAAAGGSPPPAAASPPRRFRPAESAVERWAEQGLRMLAGADPDRAAEVNDVGFNKVDGEFGHSLVTQLDARGGLSDAQWAAAARMLTKYRRQIGQAPEGRGRANPREWLPRAGERVRVTKSVEAREHASRKPAHIAAGSRGSILKFTTSVGADGGFMALVRLPGGAYELESSGLASDEGGSWQWSVVVSEPVPGRKLARGVTGPDDVVTHAYEVDGGAIVQRLEFPKDRYTAEEAAEWARVYGIKWLRVEG